MKAHSVIKREANWRIGKGNKVKIWRDPWLPDPSNPCIENPPIQGLEEATVDALKRGEGASWDVDILRDLFNDRDPSLIHKIPLSIRSYPDQWQWRYDRKGNYTVKSGYRLVLDTSSDRHSPTWQKLWTLKVPPKI